MSLQTLRKVRKLQAALHAKAKGSPGYRFYALYDKVYRADVLREAYEQCRQNGGAAGVDGQRFEDIEAYGLEKWLGELAQELREKRYRPQAVRRVYLPKPDGKQRPLGIPTVRDRVVQTAAVLVLEPIFEADLQPEQYAYRANRRALDAVGKVHSLVNTGHTEVVDADLSGYFDSIPHAELMKSVARRVSDRHMLHLIKMWLEAPVEEIDDRGRHHRTTRNKDERRGTPQGAPISPLLSNLYMRRFVLGWKRLGHEHRLRAYIVNYADDFVICCRGTAKQAMAAMREMMRALRLTVNEQKTRQCCGREISELTKPRWLLIDTEVQVARINRKLRGWSNYFCLGPVSKAYHAVDRHTAGRLRRWLRKKHKVRGRGTARYPDEYLYEQLKLIRLQERTRSFAWAKA
jgi:group II intron reverse transcriptase/maturase